MVVNCSQYRMKEYERQNWPPPGHAMDPWSANGSATSRRHSSPTGRRGRCLTQRCPQPSTRITMPRTLTWSTAVSAGAAGDRCWLLASRARSFKCARTTKAGFSCITMPQDSKRAAHTTVASATMGTQTRCSSLRVRFHIELNPANAQLARC